MADVKRGLAKFAGVFSISRVSDSAKGFYAKLFWPSTGELKSGGASLPTG